MIFVFSVPLKPSKLPKKEQIKFIFTRALSYIIIYLFFDSINIIRFFLGCHDSLLPKLSKA